MRNIYVKVESEGKENRMKKSRVCVLGAVLLICIIAVIGVLVHEEKQSEKTSSDKTELSDSLKTDSELLDDFNSTKTGENVDTSDRMNPSDEPDGQESSCTEWETTNQQSDESKNENAGNSDENTENEENKESERITAPQPNNETNWGPLS